MKKTILLLVAAMMVISVEARNYRSFDERANHFITLSLGAGENNTLTSQKGLENVPKVTDILGADALFGLGYELRFHKVFVGLQAQLDYDLTRQSLSYFEETRKGYIDNVVGSDGIRQENISYRYMYDSYQEAQNHLQGSGQLCVGGNVGQHVYVLAGAKFSASVRSGYHANIMLSTTKIYNDALAPEVDKLSDKDGAYGTHLMDPKPSHLYSDPQEDDSYLTANPFRFKVSPIIEVGARIRIPSASGRVGMRVGAYAEWAIPVMGSTEQGSNLVVYDHLEYFKHGGYTVIPNTRQYMDELIKVNSVLNTTNISRANALSLTQLTVGVKCTLLFNVTAPKHFCILCDD